MQVLSRAENKIPIQTYSSCPLCDSIKLKVRWEVNGYPIARCRNCSLVFVRTKVAAEELKVFCASADDDTNVECLNYYYQRLGELVRRRFPEPGRILDVGCSRGWFLDVMKGWKRYGNEIVPKAPLWDVSHSARICMTSSPF
jgi:hypothetical protein